MFGTKRHSKIKNNKVMRPDAVSRVKSMSLTLDKLYNYDNLKLKTC